MSLCSDFYIKECRANIHHELHGSKKLQKVFPLCLAFYIGGQRAIWSRWQEVVPAWFAGVIEGLLILVRSNFKKISKRGFQKAWFWTLDDDSRAEKIFWRWCQFARFFPCRGEGCLAKCAAWVSPGKKISSGVSKIADFRHVDMEGQMKGELPVWG